MNKFPELGLWEKIPLLIHDTKDLHRISNEMKPYDELDFIKRYIFFAYVVWNIPMHADLTSASREEIKGIGRLAEGLNAKLSKLTHD